MAVHEITMPGGFVYADEGDQASANIQSWLESLIDSFYEANYCLLQFESLMFSVAKAQDSEEVYLAKRRAKMHDIYKIEDEISPNGSEIYDSDDFEVEQIIRRERRAEAEAIWFRRKIEREGCSDLFSRQAMKVACKSYVYSLDTCFKIISRLSKEFNKYYGDFPARFKKILPDLVGLRDSFHHAEDRAVSEAYKKPIDLKPMREEWVSGDGLAHVGFSIYGDTVGATLGNGHFGKVSINHQTLSEIRDVIQDAVKQVPWRGNPQVPIIKPYS